MVIIYRLYLTIVFASSVASAISLILGVHWYIQRSGPGREKKTTFTEEHEEIKTFIVRNKRGEAFEVKENRIKEAESDGFLLVVSNGQEEHRVSYSDIGLAQKDGFKPLTPPIAGPWEKYQKPKFDPNKPYQVVADQKPKFDPDEYLRKTASGVIREAKDGNSTLATMNGQLLPVIHRSLLFRCE